MVKVKYVQICPNCGSTRTDYNVDYIFKDGATLKECANCGEYGIFFPTIPKSHFKKFQDDSKYRRTIQLLAKTKDQPYNKMLKINIRKLLCNMVLFFVMIVIVIKISSFLLKYISFAGLIVSLLFFAFIFGTIFTEKDNR